MDSIAIRMTGAALIATCIGLRSPAMGGSLDSPASPTNAASAMYTVQGVYDLLNTRNMSGVTKRVNFAEPGGGPTNGTLRTLDSIMTLVTNRAPVARTGRTVGNATDDDGMLKKGVAWPNPRFTIGTGVDGTNCVTDNLTGLMWARNANLFGTTTWGQAITNCNNLVYGGHSDWRMPNIREMKSLVTDGFYNPSVPNTVGTGKWAAGDPFNSLQTAAYYWSSSTYVGVAGNTAAIFVQDGSAFSVAKTGSYYVLPVRGGQ
jgi:hypothetical protein